MQNVNLEGTNLKKADLRRDKLSNHFILCYNGKDKALIKIYRPHKDKVAKNLQIYLLLKDIKTPA